jgi:hypothetical protein
MIKGLVLGGLALIMAQGANAAVVTVSGNFSATDWVLYFGAPTAPIDPLFLDYSATFDTDLTYTADTSVLTKGPNNIPWDFTFSYSAVFGAIVLATDGDPGSCDNSENTFCAFVTNFATGVPYFVEQSPAGGGGWFADTINDANSRSVPEPSSWVTMITGLGLVGTALRRRTALTA